MSSEKPSSNYNAQLSDMASTWTCRSSMCAPNGGTSNHAMICQGCGTRGTGTNPRFVPVTTGASADGKDDKAENKTEEKSTGAN